MGVFVEPASGPAPPAASEEPRAVAYQHRLQSNRYEYKYLVSEACALAIRDFARSYLEPDEHLTADHPYGYPVHSIYVDAPSLKLYRQTMHGEKNRFKLRLRFYDDHGPAFAEIKRRVGDVIFKQRAQLTRDGAARLLDGAWPSPEAVGEANGPGKGLEAVRNFCHLRESIGGEPVALVSYLREAYVSPDSDQVRVTFDRELTGRPYRAGDYLRLDGDMLRPELAGTIVELKFTDRFPEWMHRLVQTFSLQRCSVPKYCECVNALRYEPDLHSRLAMRIAV